MRFVVNDGLSEGLAKLKVARVVNPRKVQNAGRLPIRPTLSSLKRTWFGDFCKRLFLVVIAGVIISIWLHRRLRKTTPKARENQKPSQAEDLILCKHDEEISSTGATAEAASDSRITKAANSKATPSGAR